MAEVNSLLKQAIAAYQVGRIEQARTLLLSVIEKDEENEQAWWWLSAVVETLEDQQICLENVLALNPLNSRARQGLDTLGRLIAVQGGQAHPAPGTPPWLEGDAGAAPIGAEFDMTSGDSLIDSLSDIQVKPGVRSAPQPAGDTGLFGSWLSDPAHASPPGSKPDASAPATSVDWGREDRPATYGSGKQVDLPSEEEYDSWLQGLNLANADRARQSGSVSPFVGTQKLVDSPLEPPASDSPAPRRTAPVIEGDPFANHTETEATPPTSAPAQAAAPLSEDNEGFWNHNVANLAGAQAPSSAVFSFEDDDEDEEAVPAKPAAVAAAPRSASAATDRPSAPSPVTAPGTEAYFRAIPKDIEPVSSGFGAATLLRLAGIVLLVALNIASFGWLIISLAG